MHDQEQRPDIGDNEGLPSCHPSCCVTSARREPTMTRVTKAPVGQKDSPEDLVRQTGNDRGGRRAGWLRASTPNSRINAK